ncbi:MAG: LuxR family transcriptional regulator [Pseudomonadota bacterium]
MADIVRERFDGLLERVSNETAIDACIEIICSALKVDYVTYHLGFHEGKAIDSPFVKTNYPGEWVREYLVKSFVDFDPVARVGFNRALPCFWSDLNWNDHQAQEVARSAEGYGIGLSGYLVPVTDRRRRRAMINYSSNMADPQWRLYVADHAELLAELGEILHRHAILEIYGREDDRPALSPREIECLSWVVQGKDAATIALILDLSEHTVRDYCKSARHKLGCATLYQAIHKATLLRLIDTDSVL